MGFVPDHTANIISEEAFPTEILRVEERLEACRKSGYFSACDGKKIYYECFPAENSRGSVAVVHGMSEFTKKYYELAWYLLRQGYSVFLYDQRGHGLSHRDVDRPELIHVESFDVLVEDLNTYIETVVLPADAKPLYLYAHSMGGAVGLMYLAKYPQRFRRAVVTSPLLQPSTSHIPPVIFRWGTGMGQRLVGNKKKFVFSREYQPKPPYTHIPGDSEARIRHCLSHRDRERRYQSTPMTLGCVYHSLGLRKRLLRDDVTQSIRTPVLMLCAEKDTMVKTGPQAQFAEQCPACTRVVLPGANHALLTDCREIIGETIARTLDFYKS